MPQPVNDPQAGSHLPRPNVAERLLLKVVVGLFLVIAVGWGLSVLARALG